MTKSIEFRGIKFSTAGEAIQWTEASGHGKAVLIDGGHYVICEGTVRGRRPGDRPGFRDPSDAKALIDYSAEIVKQHGYIRFLGLPHLRDNPDVPIDRLFVEPAVSESHIQPDKPTNDWPETTPALEAVAGSQRLVLLGDPGSGKSTLVSWIAWQLTQPGDNAWTRRLGRLVPIPMILRDMEIGPDITWDGLLDAFLARPVAKPLNEDGKGRERLKDLLERGQAIVMLDGLDEIGSKGVREALQVAVTGGYVLHQGCRWILTSRIVGYESGSFNPLALLRPYGSMGFDEEGKWTGEPIADLKYVAPFSDERIERFAANWYIQHEQAEHERRERARELVAAIGANEGTRHLARVPNLLTLIALIYRITRWLPHGRALLYDRIAEAYLESIDRFRGLDGLNHPLAEKKRWLAYVGFRMQLRRDEAEGGSEREILVDEQQVHEWIEEAMGDSVGDADASARRFVDYIARRSGLLMPRGEGQFAFMHLSFQEYFAACHCLEQVTASRWLDGRAKKQSFSPDDLRGYADKP
jgi:internalin A